MRISFLIAGAIVSAIAITAAFAESMFNYGIGPTTRYVPEYVETGHLILHNDFNKRLPVDIPRNDFAAALHGADVTV